MHYTDFARIRLREIKELIETTEEHILSGAIPDFPAYRAAVARRAALREVQSLIEDGLRRDEARLL